MTVPIYSVSRRLIFCCCCIWHTCNCFSSLLNRKFAFMLHSEYTMSCFMSRKPRYDTTFRVQVTSKQDRHFSFLFLRVILFNRLNFDCKYVFFVCLSVLQVSFIPLRFRYFGRRFSFCTVDLSRECWAVPPTLRFSRKRIEIIFHGRCGPRKLNSAKKFTHVF